MKTFILVFTSVFFFGAILAQEAQIGYNADVSIPKGAEKFKKESLVLHSHKIFRHSEMDGLTTENLYVIGDLSVAFWDTGANSKKTLESIKSEALELMKLNNDIVVKEAAIKQFSNNRALIISYKNADANYYRFITEYHRNKSISGIVEFKNNDREKADAVLDKFLSSIKFKK